MPKSHACASSRMMMSPTDDDSMFVQALREDLPSRDQEERMRRRFLTLALATASLASTTAASGASAANAGWGATLVAKIGGMSWPATLVLAAAVATPVAALPIWLSPARPSEVRGRSVVALPSHANRVQERLRSEAASPTAAESRVEAEPKLTEPSTPVRESETPGSRLLQRSANGRAAAATLAAEPKLPPSVASPLIPPTPEAALPSRNAQSESTLGAETRLLEHAFTELAAGHDATAAALIAEHERRFPNGILRQERERARARLKQNPKRE
jgi:hypothetical protein